MDEFLIKNYSLITKSVEIVAALVGIICYNKFKNSNVKYFIYFLIYVVLIENIGSYTIYLDEYAFFSEWKEIIENTRFKTNHWWFSIFWSMLSTLFYAFYFNKVLKKKHYKKAVNYVTVAFIFSSLLYMLFYTEMFFNSPSSFIMVFSSLLITLIIILYFVEVLNSNRIIAFYKSMNFYIATPMFIWSIILTPLVFYDMYFNTSDWNFILLKWQIYLFTNIFMYTSFTIGLLITKPDYD